MYGIFAYIWLIFMGHVDEYTSPMDTMGMGWFNQPTDVTGWTSPFGSSLEALLCCWATFGFDTSRSCQRTGPFSAGEFFSRKYCDC